MLKLLKSLIDNTGASKVNIETPSYNSIPARSAYNTRVTFDQILQDLHNVDCKKFSEIANLVSDLYKYVQPAIQQANVESQKNLSPAQQSSLKNLQQQFNNLYNTLKVHKEDPIPIHQHFTTLVSQIRTNNVFQSAQDLKTFLKTDFNNFIVAEQYVALLYEFNIAAHQYLANNGNTVQPELKQSITILANIGRFITQTLFYIVSTIYNSIENLQVYGITSCHI